MSANLFEEFQEASSKMWKQLIQVDLKGADYNDALVWKSPEGIDVKPFYHPDEFELPFVNPNKLNDSWHVGQIITVENDNLGNKHINEAIAKGAECIKVVLHDDTNDLNNLFKNVDFKNVRISIHLNFKPVLFQKKLREFIQTNSINKDHFPEINYNPLAHLAATGNWFSNQKEDLETLKDVIRHSNQIHLDLTLFQNAGATMVQQLGYGFTQLLEYLNYLEQGTEEFNLNKVAIYFHTAVGSNYFFEIAKLRAIRLLWQSIAPTFNCQDTCAISAYPSTRNKCIYDYNVNMLRTTTESMSAVLGGANTVYSLAYDAIYHKSNEFGERIARNQLLILKNESYFNQTSNPSDGAYYIESLTRQLSEKTLDLIKSIETSGGFLNQLWEGTIQRKIKESATKEQDLFNDNALVLLGANLYPNEKDFMANELEISPFSQSKPRKVLIEPIIQKRLSEELEKRRLENENS